jgi:hypothetical protein
MSKGVVPGGGDFQGGGSRGNKKSSGSSPPNTRAQMNGGGGRIASYGDNGRSMSPLGDIPGTKGVHTNRVAPLDQLKRISGDVGHYADQKCAGGKHNPRAGIMRGDLPS